MVEQLVEGAGLVRAAVEGAVLRITLDNPPANALSFNVLSSLKAQLERASADQDVRVIVIGAAGRLFCAGHDLKELTSRRSDADFGKRFFEQTFALCADVMQSITRCPQPVIAEVDGVATAAGCQLVASCDLAIASDRARFGVNGINVGLFCTSPAVALRRNVSRKHAMEMLLTGEMIDAETARSFGLVNRTVSSELLHETVSQLAQVIASKSATALRLGKSAFNRQDLLSLADAYADASAVMVQNLMTKEAIDDIEAFVNDRRRSSHVPQAV